eukprot:scaffold73742_cov21-Tisochrysis_lutea.AAC.1
MPMTALEHASQACITSMHHKRTALLCALQYALLYASPCAFSITIAAYIVHEDSCVHSTFDVATYASGVAIAEVKLTTIAHLLLSLNQKDHAQETKNSTKNKESGSSLHKRAMLIISMGCAQHTMVQARIEKLIAMKIIDIQ